nr:MAG: putative capsid protein [Tombusviridae sp.]
MNSNGNGRRRNNRNRRAVGRLPATNTRNLVQPRAQRTLGVAVTQEAARMQMDPIRNGIRVRNREIIKSITRTATTGAIPFGADGIAWRFNNAQTGEPASPGSGVLGPYLWLGQLATLYDKYIIKKLHFEFIPSQPFTATGQVAMYWDSDPDPVTPTTYQQVSGNVYAKAVHVSQPNSLSVRPNQVDRLPQYQTSVSVVGSQDTGTAGWLMFVNQPGSLTSATTGVVALGTLWVDYEIEFLNPGNPTLGQAAAVAVSDVEVLTRRVAELTRLVDAVRLGTRGRSRSPDPPRLTVPDISLPDVPALVLPSSEKLGPAYLTNGSHTEL